MERECSVMENFLGSETKKLGIRDVIFMDSISVKVDSHGEGAIKKETPDSVKT